jgi:Ca2+-binding RTX toxin-like protein
MRSVLFAHIGSLLLLSLAVIGTTTIVGAGSTSQAWADVFEGTEGNDFIIGTPGADLIDSKGGDDYNIGDTQFGDGSGNDVIVSGEGNDFNQGDAGITVGSHGSGGDIINSGEGNDGNSGDGGADIFSCGGGDDTVTDYNEAEGDIAAPDCENV